MKSNKRLQIDKGINKCLLFGLLLLFFHNIHFEIGKESEESIVINQLVVNEIHKNDEVNEIDQFKNICKFDSSKIGTMKLLFPHVNKAGGRTLEATFRSISTRPKSVFSFISRIRRAKNVNFQLFNGHRYLERISVEQNCKNDFLNCEETRENYCSRWIFMLRNPLKRTLSAFYTTAGRNIEVSKNSLHTEHFGCSKASKVSSLLVTNNFSFTNFAQLSLAERKSCYPLNSNLHVRYLTGKSLKDTNLDLSLAKERLKKISWFGILEEFELSLKLFAYTFDVKLDSYHPIFNRNKYQHDVSDNEMKVLKEMNNLDLELYELAKAMFYKRIQVMETDEVFQEKWNNTKYKCSSTTQCWDKTDTSVKVYGSTKVVNNENKNLLCAPVGGCLVENELAESKKLDINDRCVASFLITGTRKGGTTSLYKYISQHPRVKGVQLNNGAKTGELLFFRGKKGLKSLNGMNLRKQYNSAFYSELPNDFKETYHVTGESSVDIGASCSTPELLHKACGDILKFIFLVRNPIERIISQLNMRIQLGTLKLKTQTKINSNENILETKIKEDLADIKVKLKNKNRKLLFKQEKPFCLYKEDYENVIWSSLYIIHIRRFLNIFSNENLLLIKSEDFFKKPEKVVDFTMKFLELDPTSVNLTSIVKEKYNQHNKTIKKHNISYELKQNLKGFFLPFNKELQKDFGIDVSDWL